tara:strand:+ start:141 stop:521 length:381 start_codon:yes stop_codon:yes gene_type:complete
MKYEDFTTAYDDFTTAYIECALWSTDNPNDESDDPEKCDERFDIKSMPNRMRNRMAEDCEAFQHDNEALLAELDDTQSGIDFWLTREGHGAGFWDRGLGEIGDKLTEAAEAWGSGSEAFHQHDWQS